MLADAESRLSCIQGMVQVAGTGSASESSLIPPG